MKYVIKIYDWISLKNVTVFSTAICIKNELLNLVGLLLGFCHIVRIYVEVFKFLYKGEGSLQFLTSLEFPSAQHSRKFTVLPFPSLLSVFNAVLRRKIDKHCGKLLPLSSTIVLADTTTMREITWHCVMAELLRNRFFASSCLCLTSDPSRVCVRACLEWTTTSKKHFHLIADDVSSNSHLSQAQFSHSLPFAFSGQLPQTYFVMWVALVQQSSPHYENYHVTSITRHLTNACSYK